jgi:hypothetical protein
VVRPLRDPDGPRYVLKRAEEQSKEAERLQEQWKQAQLLYDVLLKNPEILVS